MGLVEVLMTVFDKFFQASCLKANLDKCEVYVAVKDDNVTQEILSRRGMPLGSLPFKYLRVPLSSKKLSYSQYKPLLEIKDPGYDWVMIFKSIVLC